MNQPVNILYTSLFGEMLGGGQRSLLLLLKGLDRERFKPLLVCPAEGALVANAGEAGIETEIMPFPGLKRFSLSTLLRLLRMIKARDIKLIHSDSPRQAFYLGLASRLARVPMVWHVRVGDPEPWLYDRLLFALAARVIAVSRAAGSRFDGCRGINKLRVIYNSVDLERFNPRVEASGIRKEFGLDDYPVIGTMGQLLPKKGQETFLEAAAICRREYGDKLRFLVVGRGERDYTDFLKTKSGDLGLREAAVFTGFRKDIPRLLAAMDIFVLYSTYIEGFSRVIIEAMAAGKPVIATDLGGNREAVISGESGRLLRPDNDPRPLADAMLEFVRDEKKRRAAGARARRQAEENFDLRENIRKTQMIYEELIL